MSTTESSQFELVNPPEDGVSKVIFHPSDPNLLLVSSWDKTLRLYNVEKNELMKTIDTGAVALDCCFGENNTAFYGGLDHKLTKVDLETGKTEVIGEQNGPISTICYEAETDRVFVGSWDHTLCVWNASMKKKSHEVSVKHKIFSMDLRNKILVVATSQRKVFVYKTDDMSEVWQERETGLKYMLRCIRLMPNGAGFACSSIEGRVAFEFFDLSPEAQSKRYAFKTHRHIVQDTEVVYPVNTLAFHPRYGTFASGGSDAVVNIWDGENRKRIKSMTKFPDEIACVNFNYNGTKLAIASSYTFDEGQRDFSKVAIYIKNVADHEVAPRNQQSR
ncbi:mitotic checkpoint protein BUB3-like protein [Mycotypha africana]|uniref:mitotic checkpoint protein BUB3-like protein n=1 Tax=Mycotypha africana TaxID=64632 RepID=UPI0023008631|nr:mitotic checkpoint protein BUB3-like protein [Mycotypha africana]KAI8968399.1 mitotic checkpoint protein BUB3-like protein [Mycotypha africana]